MLGRGSFTEDLGAHLIRPDRRDEWHLSGNLSGIRQWIESVFDTLKGQLTLEQHGGRTLAGVSARVAAGLFALAAGIWHNWRINAPCKRPLIAMITDFIRTHSSRRTAVLTRRS